MGREDDLEEGGRGEVGEGEDERFREQLVSSPQGPREGFDSPIWILSSELRELRQKSEENQWEGGQRQGGFPVGKRRVELTERVQGQLPSLGQRDLSASADALDRTSKQVP